MGRLIISNWINLLARSLVNVLGVLCLCYILRVFLGVLCEFFLVFLGASISLQQFWVARLHTEFQLHYLLVLELFQLVISS